MKKLLIISTAVCLSVYAFIACGKKSDSSTPGASTTLYQGAGSKWTISITGSDFTINKFASTADSTAEMTINGTLEQNSTNKFMKLTVSNATGTNAPSAGSVAYGLEVPGYAFFLKPAGSSDPIVMVQSGSCPTSNFQANWTIAKAKPTMTLPMTNTQDFFGGATFTINGASSSILVSQNEPITGAALTTGGGNNNGTSSLTFNSSDCSNGLLRLSDNSGVFDMYFTSSGGALVRFPDEQIIFASPKRTSAVTQSEIAGDYSVIVFDDRASGDSVFPAKITIPASGSATGVEITDIINNTEGSGGIVFSNIASTVDSSSTQLPTGFFRASINPTSSTTNGKVSCSFSEVSSTKIIACSGYMDSSTKRPFFFLARSR